MEKTPMNFNEILKDSLKMLSRVIKAPVRIATDLDPALPVIEADANQMEQIIMNLMVNARDAMPDGGELGLKTELVTLHAKSLRIGTEVREGEYLHFSVSDTGTGIEQDIRHKIFDPFFTTKDKGKGTGLGLATVYGIAKDHGGYITVDSEFKKGSIFHVYLPALSAVQHVEKKKAATLLHGDENILIIEDERHILDLTKEILSKHGYNVIATDDPRNGIKIFQTMSDRINLVITDMIMPEINGKEVIEAVRAVDRHAKVMVVSGFADQILEGSKVSINGFIKKPFESTQLLEAVRRVLDANSHPLYR